MSKVELLVVTVFLLFPAADVQSQSVEPVDLKLPMVLFTDPRYFEQGGQDNDLLKQISMLINATPEGEEITVCVFKFELEGLANQLIGAKERGVKVRVILNKGDTSKDTNKDVKDLLQSELGDFHYIENKITDNGIIHNKFILFSRIESFGGPVNNVILQTSSNFQKKGARKLQDMLIFSSFELYFCYLDYWHEIRVLGRADQLEHYNYFTCSDKDHNRAYYFPKRRDKESFGSDEVVTILQRISVPEQAEIRFAHGKWDDNREELAEELSKLQEKGAKVEVVTNGDIDKDIRKELGDLNQGIYYLDEDYNMHTKFFLIMYEGKTEVWTGSHNLTKRSLRDNFEVLLKMEDDEIYQQYLEYFNQIKALGTP